MESTFVLNRAGRWMCWFNIVLSMAAITGLLVVFVRVAHRLIIGVTPHKQMMAVAALFIALVFGIAFVSFIVASRNILKFRVVLSDEGIWVKDRMVQWDHIQSVYHPQRTFGLAFRIMTSSGEAVDVYSVENARELERLVTERLANKQHEDDRTEQAAQFVMGPRMCTWLIAVQLLSAGGLALAFVGVIASLAGGSGFDDFPKVIRELPTLILVIALVPLNVLLNWSKRISLFGVTIFDQTINIGDVTAKWEDIDGTDQNPGFGVAFRIKLRDGRKLSVYSGLRDVDRLREIVSDKLGGTAAS